MVGAGDARSRRPRGILAAGEEIAAAVVAWRRNRRAAGQRLRFRREAAGMSQLDLAAVAGVVHEAISALELGKRSPRPETLRRLARALDVSPGTLAAGPPAEEWLTAREAAALLGRGEATVADWVRSGRLPGTKVAGRWRIPASAVRQEGA
jgi:excisionase family DNA binding protein